MGAAGGFRGNMTAAATRALVPPPIPSTPSQLAHPAIQAMTDISQPQSNTTASLTNPDASAAIGGIISPTDKQTLGS